MKRKRALEEGLWKGVGGAGERNKRRLVKEDGEGCSGIGLGVCSSPEAERIAVTGLCFKVWSTVVSQWSIRASLPSDIPSQPVSHYQ